MRKLLGLFLFVATFSPLSASPISSAPDSWFESAAALPIVSNGRVMPLESYAAFIYSEWTGISDRKAALQCILSLLVDPDSIQSQELFRIAPSNLFEDLLTLDKNQTFVSYKTLMPFREKIEQWSRDDQSDPTPLGKARLAFSNSIQAFELLSKTFFWNDPTAQKSPFFTIPTPQNWLNPAQSFSEKSLAETSKTKLSLLAYWFEASRNARWDEAKTAMAAAAKLTWDSGNRTGSPALEIFEARFPWTWTVIILSLFGLIVPWIPLSNKQIGALMALGGTIFVLVVWIVVRMIISARPPVINLPSTFLFSAAALGVIALIFGGRKFDRTLSTLAFTCLILLIGLFITSQGVADPFTPLQAVLNTNFWLSIHVPTIVLGYSSVLLSGILGHIALIELLRKKSLRIVTLDRWLRGFLLSGMILTLVGTLLGGVWADQSWGRFWGWDPKENGALLIILWTAITLHLKAAGANSYWTTAMFASIGVPVLFFSWIGVNLIGTGNHSYGYSPDRAQFFFFMIAFESLFLSSMQIVRFLKGRR